MTATLEQTEKQQMSVIFPTEPPIVHIHTLPKNSEYVTYNVSDNLTISAWMPSDFHTIRQDRVENCDEFFERCCRGCVRNCYTFLEQYMDEEGEVDWSEVDGGYMGHCFVYDNGYDGQHCPEGYEKEERDFILPLPNMVFEISIAFKGDSFPRFSRASDSAYLCAGKVENEEFLSTSTYLASNVFGTDEYPEGICWGYNRRPENLREIVTDYFATPFNNDLTSLDGFEENCHIMRSCVANDDYDCDYHNVYLCGGSDADALMLIDAEKNIPAFFAMLSAGFVPLKEAPHIMMVPIKEVTMEKNGNEFNGYQTAPDAKGKHWFITMDGLLVGQI